MEVLPTVSIIMPVLNAEATLDNCLGSICCQDYPQEKMEVVFADGGSTDFTDVIIWAFKRFFTRSRVIKLHNELKTAEAGRAIAIDAARGEILVFVDSDNILPDYTWLRRMVGPFNRRHVAMTEPSSYRWRNHDKAITRYLAMMGMADPLCYWLGNYDRSCGIGRIVESGKYLLHSNTLKTHGANGFCVRAELAKKTKHTPFSFDIDMVRQIVEGGNRLLFKVDADIVHLVSGSWRNFYRKQRRRARDYFVFSGSGYRGSVSLPTRSIVRFVLDTVFVLPLVWQAARGYFLHRRDWAWICHPIACWLTLIAYGTSVVGYKVFGAKVEDRKNWRQG